MDTMENYNALLRLSCAKIVSGRHRRGGTNLHKNLLVLTVIGKVQIAKNRLEAIKAEPTFVTMETEEDSTPEEEQEPEEDDNSSPPLEFTVTDVAEEAAVPGDSVAFASEAVEEQPSLHDESLRDRKRKSDVRQPAIPRSKSQRVSGERCVPLGKSY